MYGNSPGFVLALRDRYVKGWPEYEDDGAGLVDIAVLLTERFDTDVHFTAYSCAVAQRCTNAALSRADEADVRMGLAVFDVDGPGHAADDAWWEAEKEKILGLPAGAFVYRTRGGYRIVYRIEELPVRTESDAAQWTAQYLAWCSYLATLGISPDLSCKTWTRLFRAPHTTRDGVVQEYETLGDPRAIGTLPRIEPEPAAQPEAPPARDATPPEAPPATALLGAAWPARGRHAAQLALAGALCRDGYSEAAAVEILCAVCRAAGDEDRPKRIATVRATYAARAAGQDVTGWTALGAHVGGDVVQVARRRLAAVPEGFGGGTPEDGPGDGPGDGTPEGFDGFAFVSAAELSAPLPPVHYVVRHFGFARGRPALFAGYGGLGKTVLAQALSLHIAAGLPSCWGLPIAAGAVRHFDYEMTREPLQRRYQRLAEGHVIDLRACSLALCSMPSIYLSDDQAESALCRATEGAELAVLDNLAAAVATAHVGENEAGVRRYLDRLTRVTSRTGCAFLVLAHERKASKEEGGSPLQRVRGSSAITDACGSVISITATDTGVLTLSQNKASLRSKGDEVSLVLEDVAGDMPALPEDDSPGLVVRRVNETAAESAEATERKGVAEIKAQMVEKLRTCTQVGIGKVDFPYLITGRRERKLRALAELIAEGTAQEFTHLGKKTIALVKDE